MYEIGMITREEPMQDVDAMWEADAAAEWERINEPDMDAERIKDAAELVNNAYDSMANAIQWLYEASKEAEGTLAEDKVISIMDDLEALHDDVLSLKIRMKRGEC